MTLLTDMFNMLMTVVILAMQLSPLIILVLIQRSVLKSGVQWKRVALPVFFGIFSVIATVVLTSHFFNNPLVEFKNLFFTILLYLGLFNIPTAVLLATNDIIERQQKRRVEMIQVQIKDLN